MGPGNEALVVAWAEAALELARKGKPFEGRGRGEEASDWDACQAAKTEHAMLVAHEIALDSNMAQRQYFACGHLIATTVVSRLGAMSTCPEPRSTGRNFCGDSLWRSSLWRGSQEPRETRLDEAGRKDLFWRRPNAHRNQHLFQNGVSTSSSRDLDRAVELERKGEPIADAALQRARHGGRNRVVAQAA